MALSTDGGPKTCLVYQFRISEQTKSGAFSCTADALLTKTNHLHKKRNKKNKIDHACKTTVVSPKINKNFRSLFKKILRNNLKRVEEDFCKEFSNLDNKITTGILWQQQKEKCSPCQATSLNEKKLLRKTILQLSQGLTYLDNRKNLSKTEVASLLTYLYCISADGVCKKCDNCNDKDSFVCLESVAKKKNSNAKIQKKVKQNKPYKKHKECSENTDCWNDPPSKSKSKLKRKICFKNIHKRMLSHKAIPTTKKQIFCKCLNESKKLLPKGTNTKMNTDIAVVPVTSNKTHNSKTQIQYCKCTYSKSPQNNKNLMFLSQPCEKCLFFENLKNSEAINTNFKQKKQRDKAKSYKWSIKKDKCKSERSGKKTEKKDNLLKLCGKKKPKFKIFSSKKKSKSNTNYQILLEIFPLPLRGKKIMCNPAMDNSKAKKKIKSSCCCNAKVQTEEIILDINCYPKENILRNSKRNNSEKSVSTNRNISIQCENNKNFFKKIRHCCDTSQEKTLIPEDNCIKLKFSPCLSSYQSFERSCGSQVKSLFTNKNNGIRLTIGRVTENTGNSFWGSKSTSLTHINILNNAKDICSGFISDQSDQYDSYEIFTDNICVTKALNLNSSEKLVNNTTNDKSLNQNESIKLRQNKNCLKNFSSLHLFSPIIMYEKSDRYLFKKFNINSNIYLPSTAAKCYQKKLFKNFDVSPIMLCSVHVCNPSSIFNVMRTLFYLHCYEMKYDLNKCFLQEKVKCQTQRMNRSRSIMIKTTAINTNCSVMWLDIQKDVNENLGSPISREACTNNDHNYIEACTIKDDHSFVEALAINNNHSFVKACTINDDQSYVEACAVKDDHSFVDARAINDNHSFVRTCTVNGDQSYVEACTINNDHGCFEALDIDRSYGEACAINDDHSYAEACATNDDQFKIDAQISKKNLNVNNVFEYKHCLYQLNLNTGYSYRFARNIPLEKFVADKELSQYLAIHPRSEHTCCIQNRYGKEKTLEIKVPVQTIKCTPCSSNQMQLMRESNKIKKKMKYITKHHLIQSIKDGKICPKGKKIPMNSETKKYVIRKYHALWSKLNQKFGKKSKKSAKSQTNFLLGVDSNQTNVQIDNEEYELTFSDFKQMSETELRGIISELSKTFPLSDLTYNKEFLKCNVRGEEDMMFFLDDTDVPSLLSEENNLNNDSQNINFF